MISVPFGYFCLAGFYFNPATFAFYQEDSTALFWCACWDVWQDCDGEPNGEFDIAVRLYHDMQVADDALTQLLLGGPHA